MPRVFSLNVCKMRSIHIEKNKIAEKFDDTGKPAQWNDTEWKHEVWWNHLKTKNWDGAKQSVCIFFNDFW